MRGAIVASKEYFVIVQQREIEMFTGPFERLVYEGVKSLCGNGKIEAAGSTREIARRANVSNATVCKYLPVLIKRNLVRIVGEATVFGGIIPVYKVLVPQSLSVSPSITLTSKGVSPAIRGVSPRGQGVSGVGIKQDKVKSNKVIGKKASEDFFSLVNNFNTLFHRKLKPGSDKNFRYWKDQGYSLEDMIAALRGGKVDPFWKDRLTPEILLRQKDKNKQPVDRIGQLKALYQSGSRDNRLTDEEMEARIA